MKILSLTTPRQLFWDKNIKFWHFFTTSLLRVNFLSLCNLCWFFIGAADEIMFMFLITTKQVQMLWNYQLLIQGTYREIPKIRLADYVNRSIGYRSARIIQVRHDFPPVLFCFVFLSFLGFFSGGGGRVNVAVCLFCLFDCFLFQVCIEYLVFGKTAWNESSDIYVDLDQPISIMFAP